MEPTQLQAISDTAMSDTAIRDSFLALLSLLDDDLADRSYHWLSTGLPVCTAGNFMDGLQKEARNEASKI